MTARARKAVAGVRLTLKDAYEVEYARRQMERRRREEEERRLQAQDLTWAEALHAALVAHPDFLARHGLTADRRRYMVSLDHAAFRISAYFEGGAANVTLSDKRGASGAPRRQEGADSDESALRLIAQFLADEIR